MFRQSNGGYRVRPETETLRLYRTNRGRLVRFAAGIVADRGQAEDLVQEAFIRFDAAASKQRPDDPLAYLFNIVRNLARDGLRRRKLERAHFVCAPAPVVENVSESVPPDAILSGRDDLRILAQALADLPGRSRTALQLYRLEGLKLHEIASHLGVSVGCAHKLVTDALEHCRERLSRSA